jgi:hypothetical protein
MENIVVNNITMSHVHHYPIYITTGCRNRGPKKRTEVSYGGNITISNIIATDADSLAGIIVTGMPGYPLKNISLSNIYVQYRGGGEPWQDGKVYRENRPTIRSRGGQAPHQPMASMQGMSTACILPIYALRQ